MHVPGLPQQAAVPGDVLEGGDVDSNIIGWRM